MSIAECVYYAPKLCVKIMQLCINNQGNNHRVDSGIEWPNCVITWPKLHWSSDLHKPLLWLVDHGAFGSLKISVSLKQVYTHPSKIWLFPLPQCTVTLVTGQRQAPLRKAQRMTNRIHFWQYSWVLPQGGPDSSLFMKFWVYKLAQIWQLTERLWS